MERALDVVALVLVLVGAAGAGRLLRRRLWPGSPSLSGGIATALCATGILLVAAQVLGVAGAFALWPLVAVLGATAAVLLGLPDRSPPSDEEPMAVPLARVRPWPLAGAAAVVGVVLVQWSGALVRAARDGVVEADAFHYHLTHAAWWAQSGRLFDVRPDAAGHPAPWYPGTDEVLRSLGLLATGTEVVTLAVNVLAAALVLAAAWAVGRRVGRGPEAVLLVGLLLASPLFGPRYAGWLHSDWTSIALLLAAVAVWLDGRDVPGSLWIVGIGLGLAAGTRWTILPAVGLVALVVVLRAPAAHRVRHAGRVVGAALLVGGGWYVRNVVDVGTPLVGLPGLPGPPALLSGEDTALSAYLDDLDVLRRFVVPGLDAAFGAAWPLLALGLLAGAAWGMRRAAGAVDRWLVGVGLACLAVYVVTPTSAVGPPGEPVLFTSNLRYAWPALVLLGLGVVRVAPPVVTWIVGAAVGTAALVPTQAWGGSGWRAVGVAVAAVACGVVAVLAGRARPTPRPPAVLVPAAVVVLVGLLAWPATVGYRERRWDPGPGVYPAHEQVFGQVADLQGVAVGVVGWPMNAPFLGPDLGNDVQAVVVRRDDGAFVVPEDCPAMRRAVTRLGRDVIAFVAVPGGRIPASAAWLTSAQDAEVVAANRAAVVVRLDRPPDPDRCPEVP